MQPINTSNEVATPGAASQSNTTAMRLVPVLSVLGFIIPFSILLFGLHFTDQSAERSFMLYQQHSATILISYYVTALDGLLIMALAVLLYHRFGGRGSLGMTIATVFGVVGGLMQTIGDLRWPFILPTLAHAYLDPHATEATRSATVLIFQTVDQFAGVELSEHLYYLGIGTWSLLLGLHLLRTGLAQRGLAWLGIVSGIGLGISSIEQFDLGSFSTALLPIVLLSRILWSIWVVLLAFTAISHSVAASKNA